MPCNISTVAGAGTHHAVRAPHKAAAKLQGRSPHGINAKRVKTDGRTHDIHNGICGANLVKMYVFQGLAVHLCLCLGYEPKDAQACLLDRFSQRALRNDGGYVAKISVRKVRLGMPVAVAMPVAVPVRRQMFRRGMFVAMFVVAIVVANVMMVANVMTVMMVVMVLMMMVFAVMVCMPVLMPHVGINGKICVTALFGAQAHMNLHTLNTAAFFRQTMELKLVVDGKLGKLGAQIFGADPKINEGSQVHISADSGKTVVVQYLHKSPARELARTVAHITLCSVCNIVALLDTGNRQYN